jgi:hypothetical protein
MKANKFHFTLAEAMNLAPEEVSVHRLCWPEGIFEQAVQHHTKRNLRANTLVGTSHDCDGLVSKFTDYDWGEFYQENPSHVFHDFFGGTVANTCSRIMRGLAP